MSPVPAPQRLLRNIERGFERSRLEPQFMARAYELAVPWLRHRRAVGASRGASGTQAYYRAAVGGSR
jgi:hypothetical protein